MKKLTVCLVLLFVSYQDFCPANQAMEKNSGVYVLFTNESNDAEERVFNIPVDSDDKEPLSQDADWDIHANLLFDEGDGITSSDLMYEKIPIPTVIDSIEQEPSVLLSIVNAVKSVYCCLRINVLVELVKNLFKKRCSTS